MRMGSTLSLLFPLAAGPLPRRVPSLTPRLGFTVLGSVWPQALHVSALGPFDDVVAAAQCCLAAGANIIHQLRRVLGLQPLVPAVVHHHDRRPVAGPETFDLDQRE